MISLFFHDNKGTEAPSAGQALAVTARGTRRFEATRRRAQTTPPRARDRTGGGQARAREEVGRSGRPAYVACSEPPRLRVVPINRARRGARIRAVSATRHGRQRDAAN